MTDPTAGASTDPEATPESVTDAPAPDTTQAESTVTEDPTQVAPADPETTPSESPVVSTESPAAPASDSPTSAPAVPGRIIAAIDSSVEQGNRVTHVSEITRVDPLADLKAKIIDHFDKASTVVSDLRAIADEVETLLNTLRVGL